MEKGLWFLVVVSFAATLFLGVFGIANGDIYYGLAAVGALVNGLILAAFAELLETVKQIRDNMSRKD